MSILWQIFLAITLLMVVVGPLMLAAFLVVLAVWDKWVSRNDK